MKTFDEAISEVLDQIYSNVLAYRYTEAYEIDDITDAAKFIDNCNWAMLFGGPFKEEIVKVVSEVLEEDENDSNRNQDLDYR